MADKINQDTERSNGFPRSCTVTAAWDRAGSLHSPSSLFPPAVSSTWAPQGSECKEPSWGTSCFSHSMKVTKSQQHESGFLGLGVTGPVTHMNKCVWARTAAVGKACPDFHQSRLKVFSVYLLGFFFFFFSTPLGLQNLSSQTRDRTQKVLQWKLQVLITGLPGNSLKELSRLAINHFVSTKC